MTMLHETPSGSFLRHLFFKTLNPPMYQYNVFRIEDVGSHRREDAAP